jgi:hypothetical protein
MTNVFLSYGREDRETARLYAEAFGAEGLSVWWDQRIAAGDVWDDVIQEALEAARCVVVLWSKRSLSKRWVRSEAKIGLDRGVLIPVEIEDGIKLPAAFTLVQSERLPRWSGDRNDPCFRSIIESIRQKSKQPARARGSARPARVPNPYVATIEIMLSGNQTLYRVLSPGADPFHAAPRNLRINTDAVRGLMERNFELEDPDNPFWSFRLKDVGTALADELYRTPSFAADVAAVVARAGELGRVRVRFLVDRERFPLHLEALHDDVREWWALETSIIRRLDVAAWAPALFEDEATRSGPLNWLIVDAAEPIDGEPGHGSEECARLAALLRQQKRSRTTGETIGDVVSIPGSKQDRMSAEAVRDAIRAVLTGERGDRRRNAAGTVHVAHFAAEIAYDGQRRTGSLLVADPDGSNVAIPMDGLGRWLKDAGVRLVTMSGRNRPDPLALYDLARSGVPALLGFRLDVGDEEAADYFQAFYGAMLAEGQSLEAAAVQARRRVRDDYGDNRIWAAPLLILQTPG